MTKLVEIDFGKIANDEEYLEKIKKDEEKLIDFFWQTIWELRKLGNKHNITGSECFFNGHFISTLPDGGAVNLLIIPKERMKSEVRDFLTFKHKKPDFDNDGFDYDFVDWLLEGRLDDFTY